MHNNHNQTTKRLMMYPNNKIKWDGGAGLTSEGMIEFGARVDDPCRPASVQFPEYFYHGATRTVDIRLKDKDVTDSDYWFSKCTNEH